MKILFICRSLEVGKDGVGDYTRRLAGELIRQGDEASLIALNDEYVSSLTQDVQMEGNLPLKTIRLSPQQSWDERMNIVGQKIKEHNPDSLSLQFVLFAFQKKGLPFILAKKLKKIDSGKKWNIMFHELWLGLDKGASFKHKVWGWLQKNITRNLLSTLCPVVVFTHTRLYYKELNHFKIKVVHLPLFSNIEIHKPTGDTSVAQNKLSLVLFGGIHHGAPIDDFARELAEYAHRNNKKVFFTFFGRAGGGIEAWKNGLENEKIPVSLLGDQPPEKVSEILSLNQFGVTTTPIELIEKSSAAATMLGHHLPLICVARNWTAGSAPDNAPIENVYIYRKGILADILSRATFTNEPPMLVEIARRFRSNI